MSFDGEEKLSDSKSSMLDLTSRSKTITKSGSQKEGFKSINALAKSDQSSITKKIMIIEVQDTGKGMTAHEQENIFDEFGELLLDGIGLGLSICKKITEGMSGKISFKSQEGVGTTVRVSV